MSAVTGRVFTIGHSTRSWEDFLSLLREAGVSTVVDVRRFPASRRYPHFGGPALARALAEAGIGYVHELDLGGRRGPREGSPNVAWHVAAFRGYADHMSSDAFQAALARSISYPRPAIMVDFTGLLSWSPEAQAVLAYATGQARLHGGRLAVAGLAPIPAWQADGCDLRDLDRAVEHTAD